MVNFNLEKKQIDLTQEHLAVIKLLQDFYKEFSINPSTKALINYAKDQKPDLHLDSLKFVKLFPNGIEQACLLANIPKSPRCL